MPFAVFFDILGTSQVYSSLADDFRFDTNEWEDVDYSYARREFHHVLEATTSIATQGFLFRASFSDCAYLIYDDPASLLLATGVAMRRFYLCAPVRGGIGYGNFGLGSAIHVFDQHGSSTESSFFGSALVRAHAAEACGLKGLRVFVHASAAPHLLAAQGDNIVYPEIDYLQLEEGQLVDTLPATVIALSGESALEVSHEICFIGHDRTETYFRCLEMLKTIFSPDQSALEHYERSKQALRHFESLRQADGNLENRSS